MGKPIVRDFTQKIGILKYFTEEGKKAIIIDDTVKNTVVNGRKIVKGGTPWPSDDAKCKGIIFDDVDVTDGNAPATLCFNSPCVIDMTKVKANGLTISEEAQAATKNLLYED